ARKARRGRDHRAAGEAERSGSGVRPRSALNQTRFAMTVGYNQGMEDMAASGKLHRAFCENVRARRTQLGLTKTELATRLDITEGGYAAIESARRVSGLEVVQRVSQPLSIPATLLLSTQDTAVASLFSWLTGN